MTDLERAEALWSKLCTDCFHVGTCDCLDDILAAFAEIRAAALSEQENKAATR